MSSATCTASRRPRVFFTPEEIVETLTMITQQNLDVRTITLGLSLSSMRALRHRRDGAAHLRARHLGRRPPRAGRGAARPRVRHPGREQAHRRHAHRATRRRDLSPRPHPLGAGPRQGGSHRRHRLHRGLLGPGAQGHRRRRRPSHRLDPRGPRLHRSGCAPRSTSRRPGPASTWTPCSPWRRPCSTRPTRPPTATASAAPSW